MITIKEIENKTMSPEKRENAKKDIFAFYIGRPITYILTIPFLYTNISPNTVTYLSFIPTFLGFVLLAIGKTWKCLLAGWLAFFIWSMLDGVDGNIARYKKQYSKIGDTLDAAVGYFAMALIFFGAGIAASHNPGYFTVKYNIPLELYIVLGGLSGMFTLLPRLIMHKAVNSTGDKDIGGVTKRSDYGVVNTIALNLTSIPGLVQLLVLVSIPFSSFDLYTLVYFGINFLIQLVSLVKVFKQ